MRTFVPLGDVTDHGGKVITASGPEVYGKKVALVNDKVSCPVPGHGVNAIFPAAWHTLYPTAGEWRYRLSISAAYGRGCRALCLPGKRTALDTRTVVLWCLGALLALWGTGMVVSWCGNVILMRHT